MQIIQHSSETSVMSRETFRAYSHSETALYHLTRYSSLLLQNPLLRPTCPSNALPRSFRLGDCIVRTLESDP